MTRTVPPARSLPEDINAFLLILRRGSNDVTIIHKVSSDGEFIRIDVRCCQFVFIRYLLFEFSMKCKTVSSINDKQRETC